MTTANQEVPAARLGRFCEKHGEWAANGECRWCVLAAPRDGVAILAEGTLTFAPPASTAARDEQWRQALQAFSRNKIENLWCNACRRIDNEKKTLDCDCAEGAPLRAIWSGLP